MQLRAALVFVLIAVVCGLLAMALPGLRSAPPTSHASELDAGLDAPRAASPERLGPDGTLIAPPLEEEPIICLQPALPIRQSEACARGEPYPACRWELPPEDDAGGLYRIWRNTTPEHRWARPGLVSLVLAAARAYAMRWPGEALTIGDLDAPGPRHQTHDRGVDVDLYLPHAMADRNDEGRAPFDNYAGLSRATIRLHRARVFDLGKILATCARGRLRIYYADREVVDTFRAWFTAEGMTSDVATPSMQMHNALHRFHYHMTVAEDLAMQPVEGR